MPSRRIPNRLRRNGRPVVQDFDLKERLFRRFESTHLVDGEIYPASIPVLDLSVNRELFSRPEDILRPNYLDWGVYAFMVEDIPSPIVTNENTKNETIYTFRIEHAPDPDNYSHSEVRTYKNERRARKKISSKAVKMKFRFKLREKIRILQDPRV